MTPYYIKNPDSQSSLWHHLNETYDYICEEYHRLTKFNTVIRSIVEHIREIARTNNYKDFYSEYVWDSLEKVCKHIPNVHKADNQVSMYPIYVEFRDLDMLTSAYVDGKSVNKDKIVVYINKNYFEYFDSKHNDILDDDIFVTDDENLKMIKRYRKLFRGKDFYNFLVGDLKHEFLHVFHSYLDDEKDILEIRKNISSNYEITEMPTDVQPLLSGRYFEMYKPLMYFNCPTEQEARINGTIGYLEELDNLQVQRMIKKHGQNIKGSYQITKVITADLFYFTKLDEYKNCYDFLERNFENGFGYKGIITLAYVLGKYNLFHTTTLVDDVFVKKNFKRYTLNYKFNEDECEICREVVNYIYGRLLQFEKKIRDVVAMNLRERGLI